MKRNMHAGEVETDADLVRELLAAAFPHWAGLPIQPVHSSGTVNALYRLGANMVARLPRTDWARGAVERQERWLPILAPSLPVAVPRPLARGAPALGYPFEWGVYTWLPGRTFVAGEPADEVGLARSLAELVLALWKIEPAGGPPQSRGDLRRWDRPARDAIDVLEGLLDGRAVRTAWEESLAAATWSGASRWVHADLMPANLLLEGGRLTGVIDWEAAGVGDPALDLAVAWNALSSHPREVFRGLLDVDEATWIRGRGWALCTGLVALPYYVDTNPELAANARFRIAQVLDS
jgi:aminoglycoside phosphotransferase (APT) family kinase protein